MHDCGHAPFSHTCEKFYNHTEQAKEGADKNRANAWLLQQCQSDSRFASDFHLLDAAPADHEAFSAALMIDFFGDAVRELGADPVLAARMITGCRYDDSQTDEQGLANCLIALLHGEAIDVDKLDYLLRDTWASGVKNTAIDVDRLLHGIGIKDHGNFMGKESNIGPIDPQFSGIPAHGVIAEFQEALAAIKNDPDSIPIWQVIIGKYHPTFVGECRNAIVLASDIVKNWLATGMFEGDATATKIAAGIVAKLNNHSDTKMHARHIHAEEAKSFGLKITMLEEDNQLQERLLS